MKLQFCIVLAAVGVAIVAQAAVLSEAATWKSSAEVKTLNVSNSFGYVVVNAGGDRVVVKATKQVEADSAADARHYLDQVKFAFDEKDGVATVAPKWPSIYIGPGIAFVFEITVPENVKVKAESRGGEVQVYGVRDVEVEGYTESVRVEGAKDRLVVTGAAGPVTVKGAYGELRVETASGDVEVDNAGAPSRLALVKTASGAISATFDLPDKGGVFDFNSSSGVVSLVMGGRRDNAVVKLDSTSGQVRSPFGASYGEDRLAAAGAAGTNLVHAGSSSGDINVVVAGD